MGRPLDNLPPAFSLASEKLLIEKIFIVARNSQREVNYQMRCTMCKSFHYIRWWCYPSSPIPQLLLQSLHWPQLDTLQFRGSEGKYFFFRSFLGKILFLFHTFFFSEPYRALHLGTFFYYYVFSFGEGDTPWHFSSNFPTAVNIPFPFLYPCLYLLFEYNNLNVTFFFFCAKF